MKKLDCEISGSSLRFLIIDFLNLDHSYHLTTLTPEYNCHTTNNSKGQPTNKPSTIDFSACQKQLNLIHKEKMVNFRVDNESLRNNLMELFFNVS